MADTNCSKIQELITSLVNLKGELDAGMLELAGNRQESKAKVDALWIIKYQMETKVAELKIETDPYWDWPKYKNGQIILTYAWVTDFNYKWQPHAEGIIFFEDGQYKLNGSNLGSKDDFDKYRNSYKNRVTQIGNQFFLDGKLVYEGKKYSNYDEFSLSPQGVIIKKGDQFWLNGETLLYDGPIITYCSHPRGIIIEKMAGLNSEFYFYDHWPVEEN